MNALHYPSDLPRPQRDSYAASTFYPAVGFQPDIGPELVVGAGTIDWSEVRLVFLFTLAQAERFWRFVEVDLSGASSSFLMRDELRGGLARYSFKAGEAITADPAGINSVRIGATLIRKPAP